MNITCSDSRGNALTRLFQCDVNQVITVSGVPISPVPVFQFANKQCGTTISVTPTVSGSDLKVAIPNALLEEPNPIFAFIYRTQSTGAARTIGTICIPVKPRIKANNNTMNG